MNAPRAEHLPYDDALNELTLEQFTAAFKIDMGEVVGKEARLPCPFEEPSKDGRRESEDALAAAPQRNARRPLARRDCERSWKAQSAGHRYRRACVPIGPAG